MQITNNTNTKQKNESKKYWSFVFLFIGLTFLDLLSKHFAGNIFKNSVFAFSLPLPLWLIYFIYFVVVVGMVYYLVRNYKLLNNLSLIAWTFILSGAASNIIERMVLGYVRDFVYISFYRWTGVYNVADFYILIGIIILLLPNKKLNV